jgi:hypothetical protein
MVKSTEREKGRTVYMGYNRALATLRHLPSLTQRRSTTAPLFLATTLTRIHYPGLKIRSISRKVESSSPDEVDIFFFNLPNHSSRTMTQRSAQPLTEMNIRNIPRGKGRTARKAGNLTAICEQIV